MTEIFVPVMVGTKKGAKRTVFKGEVELYLPKRPWSELPTGDVCCIIEFHFYRTATGDVDNLLKPTLDAIKGSLIQDDRQVREIHAYLVERSNKVGFNVKIIPLQYAVSQHEPPIAIIARKRDEYAKVPKNVYETLNKKKTWRQFVRGFFPVKVPDAERTGGLPVPTMKEVITKAHGPDIFPKGKKHENCYAFCKMCMKPRNCKIDGCGKRCKEHKKKSGWMERKGSSVVDPTKSLGITKPDGQKIKPKLSDEEQTYE